MAIVLDHRHKAYGWIVKVSHIYEKGFFIGYRATSNIWEIQHDNLNIDGDVPWGCEDKYLLPIRPGDLQEHDETEKGLTV